VIDRRVADAGFEVVAAGGSAVWVWKMWQRVV
jgi:hypothetical protein